MHCGGQRSAASEGTNRNQVLLDVTDRPRWHTMFVGLPVAVRSGNYCLASSDVTFGSLGLFDVTFGVRRFDAAFIYFFAKESGVTSPQSK